MNDLFLGKAAMIDDYVITSHSMRFTLSNVLTDSLLDDGSKRLISLVNTLARFGVPLKSSVNVPFSCTSGGGIIETPLLRGRSEAVLLPSVFELAAELLGEDRFYMPVLLESLVRPLLTVGAGGKAAHTELSYGMTLAFTPVARETAIKRLTELPPELTTVKEFPGLQPGDPRISGCFKAGRRGACGQLIFTFRCKEALRPAHAFAIGEGRLWAGAELLALRPPTTTVAPV